MTTKRLDHNLDHAWHVVLNDFNQSHKPWQYWMYEAKSAADEIVRLPLLFAMERTGKLPAIHHQCSHDVDGQSVADNHLSCALGVACRDCPFLKALDNVKATPEQIDQIKAWTCVTHILNEQGKRPHEFDTSEGFVITEDDKLYWQNVYASMSGNDPENDEDDPDA